MNIQEIKKSFTRSLSFSPIKSRELRLESAIIGVCRSSIEGPRLELSTRVQTNQTLLNQVKLNFLFEKILKIISYVIKLFSNNFTRFDAVLAYNDRISWLQTKQIELLSFSKTTSVSEMMLDDKKDKLFPQIQLGLLRVQKFQYDLYYQELKDLMKYCKGSKKRIAFEHGQMWSSLSCLLQNQIIARAKERGISVDQIKSDVNILARQEENQQASLLQQLHCWYQQKLNQFDQCIQDKAQELMAPTLLDPTGKAIDPTKHRYVFKASADDLKHHKKCLAKPISVVVASVEYKGLIKEGGLAEAVEGLCQGLKQQNSKSQVTLVFPKFTHLPADVVSELEGEYTTPEGHSYKVYSCIRDGVECKLIEHVSFDLYNSPSIYGPTEEIQNERFAAFNKLGAHYIENHLKKMPDIVHLHDWHVAGIALELKKKATDDQGKQKKPAVVVTFHNHGRAAQGRIGGGIYNYQGLTPAYVKWGIVPDNTNLFAEVLNKVDFVTTVSETFAEEAQDDVTGIAHIVRDIASKGKLVGILNGANPHSFNPETDQTLQNWKDVDSGEAIDLTYGLQKPEEILRKKGVVKQQLQKWASKYMPEAKIDLSKPLVTFIGRFDASQKGLDKLEEAIEATLANGGQFICMGSGDPPGTTLLNQLDSKANEILDALQKKYTQGVLWLRDYKEEQEIIDPKTGQKKKVAKLHYQQGAQDRPGIGSLVRAASEYVFVPSSFEPCGLVQFEGWLFGSLAIGSNVGGLVDTIKTLQRNPQDFNGFLFSREASQGPKSCSAVIKEALAFWQKQSDISKVEIIQRVISQGRKSGWAEKTSQHRFSSAEKYRLVYKAAQLSAQGVKLIDPSRIQSRLRELAPREIPNEAKLEEIYLANYVNAEKTQISNVELEKLYLQIPEKIRHQFPSPYGVNVARTKYLEYGALYTPAETVFRVYAPHASKVDLVLFDDQEREMGVYPLSKNPQTGNWQDVVKNIPLGQRYQYRVNGVTKIDPYSRQIVSAKDISQPPYEVPYSVVTHSSHRWTDESWMHFRSGVLKREQGMSIYEVYPTTWKKKNGNIINYRELAHELVTHAQKVDFTHVELMGLLEHTREKSWGYQVTGFFAPNSRLGSVDDFKYFVNYLHENKIGVIMDFVPPHFARFDYGLQDFDGTKLFEPENTWSYKASIRALFYKYGAKHFDFSKQHVREFLISSANFWLQEMHIDGLRVDCIASMIYSEKPAASKLFLQDLNAIIHRHKGAFSIAEDYSGHDKILKKSYSEGLGFDFKWDVNWMNVVKEYFSYPSHRRKSSYHKIKEIVLSSDGGYQIPFISHDDTHDKNGGGRFFKLMTSLQSPKEKIAAWRSIIPLLMTSQGHKLLFSGVEFNDGKPWNQLMGTSNDIANRIDDTNEEQKKMLALVYALNQVYKQHPVLHGAGSAHAIDWIEDPEQKIHSYRVRDKRGSVFVMHNFTNEDVTNFRVNLPRQKKVYLVDNEKSRTERKVELKKNLDRIEHKIWFVALRLFIDKLLNVVFRRKRHWIRLYVEQGGKQVPLLLRIAKVVEVTLATHHQILEYSQSELFHLLSTPVVVHHLDPKEILNSDAAAFGGKNKVNPQVKVIKEQAEGMIYEVQIPAGSSILIEEYNNANS